MQQTKHLITKNGQCEVNAWPFTSAICCNCCHDYLATQSPMCTACNKMHLCKWIDTTNLHLMLFRCFCFSSALSKVSSPLWWMSSPGLFGADERSSSQLFVWCPTWSDFQISRRYSKATLSCHSLQKMIQQNENEMLCVCKRYLFSDFFSATREGSMCSNSLTTTLPAECLCCSWSSLSASPYPGSTVCNIKASHNRERSLVKNSIFI